MKNHPQAFNAFNTTDESQGNQCMPCRNECLSCDLLTALIAKSEIINSLGGQVSNA